MKNRVPRRVEGTCEWFTSHHKFSEWKAKRTALLWVSADPGCWKSVLARYLADDVLAPTPTTISCYVFFKGGIELQETAASALCCILHQVFKQSAALASPEVIRRFKESNKDVLLSSFDELWEVLLIAARGALDKKIICIVDALDECQGSDQKVFLKTIKQFYSKPDANRPSLSVLLTSPPIQKHQPGVIPLGGRFPNYLAPLEGRG
jgi:hypothetical protein